MDFGTIVFVVGQYLMVIMAGYLIVVGMGQLPMRIEEMLIKHYVKKKERLEVERDYERYRDEEEDDREA